MAKASLMDVKAFFSVPGKPVTMTELKQLTSADRAELLELVDVELNGAAS